MKRLFTLFIFITIFCLNSFAQQLQVLSQPDFKEMMNDIYFVNENTGWIAGAKGYIYKTTDGGDNWSEQVSGISDNIQRLFFTDENKGWAGVLNGAVLKTTDGGNNWIKYSFTNVAPNVAFSLFDVLYFTDENTGYAVAGKLKAIYLLRTTDGGVSWTIKDSMVTTSNMRWYDLDFREGKGSMAGDQKNRFRYSTDNGINWGAATPIVDGFFGAIKSIKWLNGSDVIAIGEGNEFNGVPVPIYKSTNGGIDWVKKNQSVSTVYDRVKDAYFKNGTEGIGVGSNGFSKIFIIKTSDGGENWSTSTVGYSFGLQALSGIGDKLFALGSSTHIIKSSDFGNTWENIKKKAPASIYGMQFIGGKGYAATRNGDFYICNDGTGNEWEYLSSTGSDDLKDILFLDGQTGFAVKENRHISKTTDGGVTWRSTLTPTPANTRSKVGGISFADWNNGYAWMSLNQYGEYYAWKTTDNGESWTQTGAFAGPGYVSGGIVTFDANTSVLLGPDNWTMRTTDGGVSWNPASLNSFPQNFNSKDFEGVTRINSNKAVAIGEGFIAITTDMGANWEYINHGLNGIDSSFYTITSSGDTLMFIGCYNGAYLKSTDGGNTWMIDTTLQGQYYWFTSALTETGKLFFGTSNGYIVGEKTISGIKDDANIAETFRLEQNYPNPFNPSTTIEFYLKNGGNVKLSLHDIIGNEVRILVSDYMRSGKHKYELDMRNAVRSIASGIYFVRLEAENQTAIRKIVYLK